MFLAFILGNDALIALLLMGHVLHISFLNAI